MKNLLAYISLAFFFMFNNGLLAQDRGRIMSDPIERAEKQTQLMDSICILSTPQKERIKNIQLRYAALTKQLFDKREQLPRDSIRYYMEAINEDKTKEINSFLTEQQIQLWTDHLSTQRERRKGFKNN